VVTTRTRDVPDVLANTARRRANGDSVFRGLTLLAGAFVLAVLVAIAVFLVVKALPTFSHDTKSFWTTFEWLPDSTPADFGVAALAFGTALSAVLALLMAFPVAVAVALFITDYAPRRLARWLGYITDLLAAVPSVVFGLWGLYWLVPHLTPLQHWLADNLGLIPLFADSESATANASRSIFAASVVLAIMVLPIISAIAREVFQQVDPALKEAALGLGSTRWEMIRTAVMPPSKGGLAGATILGLGRALGETIAVALVLGSSYAVDFKVLVPGKNTIAANIATQFGEAGSVGRPAHIASGLVLFAMTMGVTVLARWIIYRAGAVERSVVA
jgi:phosphate transport system permease protein